VPTPTRDEQRRSRGAGLPLAGPSCNPHLRPKWPRGCRSSVVEHPLGKGEVVSSILTGSTILSRSNGLGNARSRWPVRRGGSEHLSHAKKPDFADRHNLLTLSRLNQARDLGSPCGLVWRTSALGPENTAILELGGDTTLARQVLA